MDFKKNIFWGFDNRCNIDKSYLKVSAIEYEYVKVLKYSVSLVKRIIAQ